MQPRKKPRKAEKVAALSHPQAPFTTFPDCVLFSQNLVGVDRTDIFVLRKMTEVVIAIADRMHDVVTSQAPEWLQSISKESIRSLFDAQQEKFPERSILGRMEPFRSVFKSFFCFTLPALVYKSKPPKVFLENGVFSVSFARSKENQTFF